MGGVILRWHPYALHMFGCPSYVQTPHTLSYKSMELLPGNTTYQAKHIPDACEHSGKKSCCNIDLYGLETDLYRTAAA